jgi:histone deacetylase complex regulatory component SIN3
MVVLNDKWVFHLSFLNEDSVFRAHKKNLYKKVLHRTKEEQSLGMTPEEHAIFCFKLNFGGVAKAIHQCIIKKIYG